MTAKSPISSDTSLVSFTIKVDGKAIDSTYQVISIDTWNSVNKVPKAQLVIFDGSAAESNFEISDSKIFIPGNKIEINVGYNQKEQLIFSGVIVKQGIEITRDSGSKLIVDVTDEAIKMTLERKNALFEKVKDSDLISQLITSSGLKKQVTATTNVNPEIVQYYTSDWDLMITRAELNSLIVYAENGKVIVEKPNTQQAPDLVVKYGDSILDLQLEMDAATQYSKSSIKSFSWDVAQQKVIDSGPGSVSVKEPGNISSSQLADVFKVKKYTQQTGGYIDKTSLQNWSSAELQRSMLSKIRGSVLFQGSALAKTGTTIELAGLGQRFNGNAFISGVNHSVYSGKWLTRVEVGLSSKWFTAKTPNIAANCASGQIPPVKGLQTAIVKKIAKDPDGEYRVFVTMPILQDNANGIWARLGNFYASNKFGAMFYPEVNDEVIVGFMNEDPRYGVILGSLYSKKLAPPYPVEEKNEKKVIKTKSGLEIIFDEKEKSIDLITPAKQQVKINDKDKSIIAKDANGNELKLSKSGIDIKSASNINMTAKGNIKLDAKGNLQLKATAKASMEGLEVSHQAKTKFSAKGNASAEITASGITTVKGAMVKIN
ncbi:type VI secretion system tip protein VgrG [Aliikangiella sp. IMCC44359]|uniref:type VI secretion system tip protein VgrG n=1 Tax=Aliikangiella sp. IMCC44359 TaxID=3459125 RepID=UPI00403B14E9